MQLALHIENSGCREWPQEKEYANGSKSRVHLVSGNANYEMRGSTTWRQEKIETCGPIIVSNEYYDVIKHDHEGGVLVPEQHIDRVSARYSLREFQGREFAQYVNAINVGLVLYGIFGPEPVDKMFERVADVFNPDMRLLEKDDVAWLLFKRHDGTQNCRFPWEHPSVNSALGRLIAHVTDTKRKGRSTLSAKIRRKAYCIISAVSNGTWRQWEQIQSLRQVHLDSRGKGMTGHAFLATVWEDAREISMRWEDVARHNAIVR